jgi:hypothetical protein
MSSMLEQAKSGDKEEIFTLLQYSLLYSKRKSCCLQAKIAKICKKREHVNKEL